MINEFEKDGSNVTLKQAVDICKGRAVKTPQLNENLADKFKGMIKTLIERDVRRLMLQMLK